MSFIDNIKSSFQFPSEIIAVELNQLPDREYYSLSHLKLVKDEIQLLESRNQNYIEGLSDDIDKKIPVFLVLNGKKVLSKRIDYKDGDDSEKLISKAFPSVRSEDLEFQVDYLTDSECVISVIRKDVFAKTLQSFDKESLSIVDFSLGVNSLFDLLQNDASGKIQLAYTLFDIESKRLEEVSTLEGEVKTVFEQEIQSGDALSFAFGLKVFADRKFQTSFDGVTANRKDWQFQNYYKKSLVAGVCLVFVLLLSSFGIYSYYFENNKDLLESTASYDSQLSLRNELEKSIGDKEEFLRVNGSSGISLSRMSDEIASVLPKQLSLSELSLHPLEKRLKREKLVRFYRGQLSISGETKSYIYFQQWFNALEEMDWVEDIDVVGYQEKNDSHRAEFSIKVMVRE